MALLYGTARAIVMGMNTNDTRVLDTILSAIREAGAISAERLVAVTGRDEMTINWALANLSIDQLAVLTPAALWVEA